MKLINNPMIYITISLLLLGFCTQEIEARRKILRGRQVITRTYNRGLAVPAWAIVLMSGIGMVVLGALLYFVMHKIILSESDSKDLEMTHMYAAAPIRDDS